MAKPQTTEVSDKETQIVHDIAPKKIPPHLLPRLVRAFRAHYQWILSQEQSDEASRTVPPGINERAG